MTSPVSSTPQHVALGPARTFLAILSLGLGSFASVTAEFLPVGVLPEVADSFGVTAGSAGLMMTLPGIFAAISAPGVMLVAGRMDRRLILLILSAILIAACGISAGAGTFAALLVGRALVGVSLGAFWAMALAVATRLVPPERSQKATAAVFAGVTAAMILGVPLGNFVAAHSSWRGAFIAAGGIALIAMILQISVLPKVPGKGSLKFDELIAATTSPEARRSMLMISLVFAAHFGAYTYLAPLLHEAAIKPAGITYVLLGYGVAGFLSTFVTSHFVGRSVKYSLAMAKAMLLIPLGVMPLLLFSPSLEIALVMVWGMAWGALPLCLNLWNQQAARGGLEAKSAAFTFTTQVAIAAGSSAGGVIVDSAGVGATFWVAAGAVAVSLGVLGVARPLPQRS
ncbi:MFS transporter [Stenotrophomonas tuberculopleuritidis]|uniref:MFS transporter n=1 Tax=Stenotrophomonas tuberculopleuritidis TaxID=3055079 RepID=UPI0026E531AD|nr:MFS transporter [Stenotrophomonas sp. 704A1]